EGSTSGQSRLRWGRWTLYEGVSGGNPCDCTTHVRLLHFPRQEAGAPRALHHRLPLSRVAVSREHGRVVWGTSSSSSSNNNNNSRATPPQGRKK
ncbi:unnamed protein product, partial [Ectocarpus sp. 4 AP-2014]